MPQLLTASSKQADGVHLADAYQWYALQWLMTQVVKSPAGAGIAMNHRSSQCTPDCQVDTSKPRDTAVAKIPPQSLSITNAV